MDQEATIRDRWLGALSYLSILVFIPLFATGKSPFLTRHCRQGFAIFCLEVLGLFLLYIIDSTFGVIPFLGAVVMVLVRLAMFLGFLVMSTLGFSKAMFGESWRVPYLDDWAERLPIH
ncbi:hypothetical protein GW813_01260 [bacterium]|nr:hypothetical protein [bacterium]PJA75574.1 MAG: hypothetical protein CO151_05090 [bacterium CG_4_9_14_3_um_filter_65_15]